MIRRKSNTLVISVIVLLTLIAYFPLIVSAAGTELVSPAVDIEIERLMTEGNIPSLHVCVVSDDSINWARGFGEETNLDTPFLIGSIQKVFVAISVMQLYEAGEIDLDENVSEYLPFNLVHPIFPNIPITVRMLLSHRSGLGSYLPYEFCYDWSGVPYPEWPVLYTSGVIDISLSEYLEECLTSEGQYYSNSNWLSWEPDTEYSYANSGFKLLMSLLETVTGLNILDYMQENIFTPLRLNNTGFDATELNTPQATPYTRNDVTNIALPVWNGKYMIRSSVRDMGHLLIALMNMGEFDGQQILQSETVEMMLENTYSDGLTWDLRRELRWKGYGLGLDIFSHNLHGHGGSTIGFTSDCHFNPALRRGFIRLSNVNSILDPSGEEWRDIYDYTNAVRTLVLTQAGMIPPISILELSIILGSGFCAIAIIRSLIRRRKRKATPSVVETNLSL